MVLTVGPYVVLVLLAGISVWASSPADLVLCAVLAIWLPARRVLRPAVFVTVLILLTAVLVVRSPWFGFFTPVLYVHAFRLLRWPWQPIGVGAVAVVAGTSQTYAVDKTTAVGLATWIAVVAANVFPMCAYAWFERRAAQQNAERERALAAEREANAKLAESLAENAALHEQLLVRARDAGVQDERQRMAREIHDTLAQGFIGIISQLSAAENRHEDPATWRRHLGAATKLARENLTEARRSVHALSPEPLRSARLGEALAGVAERWSALHEIPVQVTTTGAVRPIGPEAEAALLRIAQEALTNVAKHASATRVGVTLTYFEREAALDVRDDGAGFDPDRRGGGFGLTGMRQRVEGLSGTLHIESEPGAGTGISARVPSLLA